MTDQPPEVIRLTARAEQKPSLRSRLAASPFFMPAPYRSSSSA